MNYGLIACLYWIIGCIIAVCCAIDYRTRTGRDFTIVEWLFAVCLWPLCLYYVGRKAWKAVRNAM